MSSQDTHTHNWINPAFSEGNGLIELMKKILDTLPVGVYVSDKSGNAFFWNKIFSGIFHDLPIIENIQSIIDILLQLFPESGTEIKKIFEISEKSESNVKTFLENEQRLLKISSYSFNSGVDNYRMWAFEEFYSNSALQTGTENKNQSLTEQLLERNIYLTELNRQLKVSGSELTDANESKDKFLSVIAHDLKNPFQGLLGMCDVIITSDDIPAEDIRSYVGNIKSSASNIYQLIEKLLQWSRLQIGHTGIKPVNCDLRWEVSTILNLFKNDILKKTLSVENNIGEDLVIYADEHMLGVILRNLISNAIKFSLPNGRIKINSRDLGTTMLISVEDNGIGISGENINKIFKKNEIITTRGTNNEEGSGLGLILVKEMLKLHGGTIRIQSEPGKGSAFNIELPKTLTRGQIS